MRAAAGSSTAVAWARQKSFRRCVTSASTVSPGMAPSTKTTRPSTRATAAPPWASSPTVSCTASVDSWSRPLADFRSERCLEPLRVGPAFGDLHALTDQERQGLGLSRLEIRHRLGVFGDDLVGDGLQFGIAADLARALQRRQRRPGIWRAVHRLEGLLRHLAADHARVDELDQLLQVGGLN